MGPVDPCSPDAGAEMDPVKSRKTVPGATDSYPAQTASVLRLYREKTACPLSSMSQAPPSLTARSSVLYFNLRYYSGSASAHFGTQQSQLSSEARVHCRSRQVATGRGRKRQIHGRSRQVAAGRGRSRQVATGRDKFTAGHCRSLQVGTYSRQVAAGCSRSQQVASRGRSLLIAVGRGRSRQVAAGRDKFTVGRCRSLQVAAGLDKTTAGRVRLLGQESRTRTCASSDAQADCRERDAALITKGQAGMGGGGGRAGASWGGPRSADARVGRLLQRRLRCGRADTQCGWTRPAEGRGRAARSAAPGGCWRVCAGRDTQAYRRECCIAAVARTAAGSGRRRRRRR
jgi:hypothetical protein